VEIDIGGDVGRLRIGGLIDRVDRQGDRVIVIDYKTGSTPISTNEMQEGRNFQMMVYLLATKVLLDADPLDDSPRMVAGGLFWHIRNRKGSGQIVLDEEGLLAMERAQAHLARYIAAGRTGDFAVQPNKPDRERCVRYCEFYQLCRTGRTNRYKF